jgi:ribonuclease P protein component
VPNTGFSKKLRLTKPAEFKAVFSNVECKVSCQALLMIAKKNGLCLPRLGLVISKKNVSTSVQRNRIRRVIRNSFRLNQELLTGLDIVILARSNLDLLSNEQLGEKLQQLYPDLLRKAGRR